MSLEVGKGITCRPNPSVTLLVCSYNMCVINHQTDHVELLREDIVPELTYKQAYT